MSADIKVAPLESAHVVSEQEPVAPGHSRS